MSLVARSLEAKGIPTLIIGSAMDIVTHVKAPRYLHVDFPLGNPCGRPFDAPMQQAILALALEWLKEAEPHASIARAPFEWSTTQSWRDNYSRVDESNRDELRLRGEQRRTQQEQTKLAGGGRSAMISET